MRSCVCSCAWSSSSAAQSINLKSYLDAVRATLSAAMCLENFSSQAVERHNKPEVETTYVSHMHIHTRTQAHVDAHTGPARR